MPKSHSQYGQILYTDPAGKRLLSLSMIDRDLAGAGEEEMSGHETHRKQHVTILGPSSSKSNEVKTRKWGLRYLVKAAEQSQHVWTKVLTSKCSTHPCSHDRALITREESKVAKDKP